MASPAVPTETGQQTTTRVQRETPAEHTSTEEQSTLTMPRVETKNTATDGQITQSTSPLFASTKPFQQTSTKVHRESAKKQITTKPGTIKTTFRAEVEDTTTEGQTIQSTIGRQAYQTSAKPQTSELREQESSTSQSSTSSDNTVITGQLTTQQAITTDVIHGEFMTELNISISTISFENLC